MAETNRELVERIYRAALAGVEPGLAVHRALDGTPDVVIALGKAAPAMADAVPTDRRIVLGPDAGDHPVPGARSAAAARRLEQFVATIRPEEHVLVLLSGGTSSLVAGPVDGGSADDLAGLFRLLLTSGLDIHAMNLVRKRYCRWGGGRLARALPGGPVTVYAVSDVAGDRLEDIGSGPCVPDPTTTAELIALLQREKLWDRLPTGLRRSIPETPKPGDPKFDRIRHVIVANNATALAAAEIETERLGLDLQQWPELRGDAADTGRRIAREISQFHRPSCLLAGGETTVTVAGLGGLGGRCQELALAAALELEARKSDRVTLLAAGSDGRDGPTDAAGAIVDGTTAARIRRAGLDPLRHLHEHNAYPALDAAGALLRTGPTGTNVRDLLIALWV